LKFLFCLCGFAALALAVVGGEWREDRLFFDLLPGILKGVVMRLHMALEIEASQPLRSPIFKTSSMGFSLPIAPDT
jgi:hypothetical protein